VESHGQRLKEIAEGLENTEPESEWMTGSHLNQCSTGKKKVVLACVGSWVAQDNMNEEEVKAQGSLEKKKTKRKPQIQATRQSMRLKSHGGIPVEKLATKRKMMKNLEISGTS
jgi:hypothetical protein